MLATAADDFPQTIFNLSLNPPESATRMGRSTARDTTPDLSFLAGNLDVIWTSTHKNFGSDHDIAQLTIRNKHCNVKIGVARITNWDAFRKATSSRSIDTTQRLSTSVDDLVQTVPAHSKSIVTSYQTPSVAPKNSFTFWKPVGATLGDGNAYATIADFAITLSH